MGLHMVGLPATYRQLCRARVGLRTEEMAPLRAVSVTSTPRQPGRKSNTGTL